jgi:hypothetical protein
LRQYDLNRVTHELFCLYDLIEDDPNRKLQKFHFAAHLNMYLWVAGGRCIRAGLPDGLFSNQKSQFG